MRLWACGNSVGFGRRHRAGTGVLLDVCAMLKSLFAALAILHLLRSDLIRCFDGFIYGNPTVVVPAWFVQQQCKPTLNVETVLQLFTAAIVLNQLTFILTSFITHANPFNILRHARTRLVLGYSLAFGSFLFGFCKIGLIVSITITSAVTYPCIYPSSELSDRVHCAHKQILVPATLSMLEEDSALYCSCGFKVPPEVYILSMTFVLTFAYSVFMCDQLMHRRPDEEAREDAEEERHRAELEQNRMDEQETTDEHYKQDPKLMAQRKSQSNSQLGIVLLSTPQRSAPAEAAPVAPGSVSASMFVEMDSGSDAEKSISNYSGGAHGGIANLELSRTVQPSPSDIGPTFASGAVRRSTVRSSNIESAAPAPTRRGDSSLDMIALDPLTRRALEVAGTFPSQQLLLATVESDLRKHLSNRLRNRDLIYRLVRDSATLLKFMLTIVSLSLILYNVGGSVISCDKSDPHRAADISLDLTPAVILRSCDPRMSSNSLAFLFSVVGVVVAALFVVIIIVEKRVLLPAQAKWLSAFLLTAVALLLSLQLLLMVEIEETPLDFPCSLTFMVANQSLSERSHCRNLNLTISRQTVLCHDRCGVSLGATTYLLFFSLFLSLVYLASLVIRYQDLARIITATRLRMDTEMGRLLQPKRIDAQGEEQIDPKQVVLAILAKY